MHSLWQNTQAVIQTQVNERTWEQYFQHLIPCEFSAQKVVFEVPDAFFATWFQDHYLSYLKEVLRHITGGNPEVTLVPRPPGGKAASDKTSLAARERAASDTTSPAVPSPGESSWHEEDSPSGSTLSQAMSAAARAAGGRVEVIPSSHEEAVLRAGLNPRYTFDQYVVGGSNQFSHAACRAVAERPARAYNPLFLHGGVGLGKTHLLHAVGIEVLRRWPQLRVTYISSEGFMNELIHSLRTRDTNSFRTRFRDQCDLLLMDDIQFIAGKDSTQEEFFHTFNALHQAHRQIVITSDKLPGELPGLEERLRSRFAWGLIADIQPPDIETRIAIISKKAEEEEMDVPGDVALYLATHIRSNVRELEGSLVRLKAYASLYNQPVTLEMAKAQLKTVIREQTHQVTVERIQRIVSNYYNVKPKELLGERRHRAIAQPRHIAMYLSRHHTNESFPEIGKQFGGRDHSTVMNAVSKIEKSLLADEALKEEVRALEALLQR
jgi:chromosomal replication initiator protein